MEITIIATIQYALGIALLSASIHAFYTNMRFEVDDFQIFVDHEVVSGYLLDDTAIRLVCQSFLHHVLTSSGFRYDPSYTM
jgi:hypothetical protein